MMERYNKNTLQHSDAYGWKNMSLQRRLIAIILTVTLFSLCIGFGFSLIYDYRVSKVDLSSHALFVSKLIGDLSSAPLNDRDNETADHVLQKLLLDDNFLYCRILDEQQNEFASFGAYPENAEFNFPFEKYGVLFESSYLYVHSRIMDQDELVGSVFMIYSTFEISSKLLKSLRNIVLIALFVLVFAVVAANRLQLTVSKPILNLADVMRDVSNEGNYNLRVTPEGRDEIGSLYIGFNKMLEQIQFREEKQKAAELQIKKSEERYRLIVENQTDLIVKIDSRGRFLFVSQSYCQLFDKNYLDLVGTTFMPAHEADDQKLIVKALERLKHPPFSSFVEHQTMTAKGQRWLAWEFKAILNNKDEVVEIIADGRDVTDQKRAEINLRKSEERFRTLFENMAQGVFYHRAKDNHVYNANHAALDILGLSLKQLQDCILEKADFHIIQEDGSALKLTDFPSLVALRTGQPVRSNILGFYHAEKREYVWVSVNAVPLFMPDAKKPYEAFVTMYNVTQVKKAQAEVQVKSRALDQSINGFYIINKEGLFVYVNKAYLKMWGYESADEILGTSAAEHYSDKKFLESVITELHNKEYVTTEFTAKRQDLSTFQGLLSAYVYIDETGEQFYAGSTIDITQKKIAEAKLLELNHQLEDRVRLRTAQYEAVNKDLEAFAYSVSHDLRAPLRHISGFTSIAESELNEPSDNINHYFTKIKNASQRMQTMIDDLLAFSRIGRKQIDKKPIVLNDLVDMIITEYQHEIKGRTIEWKIELSSICIGDENLIKLVLENLISNAIKFTSTRSSASIEIGEKSIENNYAEIFVKDNGVGFDSNYTNNLFNVFQRLHSEEEFPGTGIGLANVKRIIEKHGGWVRAQGEIDKGAVFYFTLPKEDV